MSFAEVVARVNGSYPSGSLVGLLQFADAEALHTSARHPVRYLSNLWQSEISPLCLAATWTIMQKMPV